MGFTVISTALFAPAKIHSPSTLPNLRTPCGILRLPLLLSLSPTPKTISAKTFSGAPIPQKYVYPDPIPEFAEAETQKFRAELLQKLVKEKETFGDYLDMVVDICAEIFGDFMRNQYGGPGTLLVEPFTYMLVALKQKDIPGAPLAARTSLLWAQNSVDEDWEAWISNRDFST